MLKDDPAGKKTGLAEERTLAGTWGKSRVYRLGRKGQAAREDYKGVTRLCRGKIREVKAQLELWLATALKDNKKHFLQIR